MRGTSVAPDSASLALLEMRPALWGFQFANACNPKRLRTALVAWVQLGMSARTAASHALGYGCGSISPGLQVLLNHGSSGP